MKRPALLLGLGVILVIGSATPALATSSAKHQHHPVTQVMHLHVVPVSFVDTPTGYVSIDDDFDADGTQVGSDVTTCRAIPGPVETARCDVGLGLAGGLITITFTQSAASETAYGRVTGGTGIYTGVRGSVVIEEGEDGADVTLTLRR